MYTITIVGLGLIGGSLAKALKGCPDTTVYGINHRKSVVDMAVADRVIANCGESDDEILQKSDMVILCLYPSLCVDFVKEHIKNFKKGALLTDVCGIKEKFVADINSVIRPDMEFVGAHPMAGREVYGYVNSLPTLFNNCNFLITPTPDNTEQSIKCVEKLAKYVGAKKIVRISPHDHDEMIAYTSQLMHVIAVALCDNKHIEIASNFSAGSLRDCTRVAVINEILWSELFIENKDALCILIDEMKASLDKIENAIKAEDYDTLKAIMKRATEAKLKYLNGETHMKPIM
ncbi:MAG: prephenate dehydrogenase [Clostridia bacterium]|nr:prephenate dehydrogenase [Clostridia bacterium]